MAALRHAFRSSVAFVAVGFLFLTLPAAAQVLTPDEQEAFLKSAKVVRVRDAGKGVTGTLRATLSDGTTTHDASIQSVDVSMREFKSDRGTELNFRDSWRYNVAAYRLNQILQLGRIPVSIERRHNAKPSSFTWWVDDVLMDEGARLKGKHEAPDSQAWNEQMWHVRLFDQLIQNVDRNAGNLLIDNAWTIWMIDHSRAFRLWSKPTTPKNLTRVERGALDRLKQLDMAALDATVGEYLTSFEKRALLQRRDAIVAHFEKGGVSMIYARAPQ